MVYVCRSRNSYCLTRRIIFVLLGMLGSILLFYTPLRVMHNRIFTKLTSKKITDAWQRGIEVKTINGAWQVVNASIEMYLFSAYYDVRPSLLTSPVIRVIGVSESKVEKMDVYCYIWYPSSEIPSIEVAGVLPTGFRKYRHGKFFREHIYTCKLNGTIPVPKAISIELGMRQNSFPLPSTYTHVQIPEKPETKRDFINCVKATYGKIDPYAVVEWMELQKIWGVDKVTIYNSSIEGKSLDVFRHYQNEGFVDFRQAPQFLPDAGKDSKRLLGTPTICDCMYRNMYKYEKIVVTDLDEMIVPRTTLNYKSMLHEINIQQPSDHAAKSYIFRNAYFFTDHEMPEDNSMPKKLTTMRHRVRLPPSPPGYWVKSIIDPQACVVMHYHMCWVLTKGYSIHGHSVNVNVHLGMNQHYKKCHFDKYLEQPGWCAQMMKEQVEDDTMLRFRDDLERKVFKQLEVLGLDH